jgi:hypothetical protein
MFLIKTKGRSRDNLVFRLPYLVEKVVLFLTILKKGKVASASPTEKAQNTKLMYKNGKKTEKTMK